MSDNDVSKDVESWISDTDREDKVSGSSNSNTAVELTRESKDNKQNENQRADDEEEEGRSRHMNRDLMDNFIPLPPKLPVMSSLESMLNISPYSSSSNYQDDYVIYSDSEIGSQNSLELSPRSKILLSGASSREESPVREYSPSRDSSPSRAKAKRKASRGRKSTSTPRRDSSEPKDPSTPKSKIKRRIRRKSTKSDGSEMSHPYIGSGYNSTPATGKVFRNLLILEESLRQQVFQQKALRRKYLTFMAILCSLIASISHYLYLSGDSPTSSKSSFRVILTFVLLALMVTLLLYYLSGEYQKTIVLPRRFLSSTNKGLRQLNIRLVKIKIPLIDYLSDLLRELVLYFVESLLNLLHKFDPSSFQNKDSKLEVLLVSICLQCQPRTGIADVKLVLNARVFTTDIREGWELYRSEFWLQEGMRRRNNLLAFISGAKEIDEPLKEKPKRRTTRKRSSTVNNTPVLGKLNEENLEQLADKLNEMPQERNL